MNSNLGRVLLALGLILAVHAVVRAESNELTGQEALDSSSVRILKPGAKLMIGGGLLSAKKVRSDNGLDDGTGFVLSAGVGYLVGRRTAWEFGVLLYNDRLGLADISLLQLKSTWRRYVTADPAYQDQAYVLAGPTIVLAGDDGIGDRLGIGLVLGGGVDVFCGGFGAAFVQADLTFLLMTPEATLSTYAQRASVQSVYDEGSPFGAMAHLLAGARFDL